MYTTNLKKKCEKSVTYFAYFLIHTVWTADVVWMETRRQVSRSIGHFMIHFSTFRKCWSMNIVINANNLPYHAEIIAWCCIKWNGIRKTGLWWVSIRTTSTIITVPPFVCQSNLCLLKYTDHFFNNNFLRLSSPVKNLLSEIEETCCNLSTFVFQVLNKRISQEESLLALQFSFISQKV